MPRKDRRPVTSSQDWPEFRYSKSRRDEIAAALPVEEKVQVAIEQLERFAHEYFRDRARRSTIKTDKLRNKSFTRAIKKYPYEDAGVQNEKLASLAQELDALTRLSEAFHGTDFDWTAFALRALSIWEESGGRLNRRYIQKQLERFLVAAMEPVLGAEMPKPTSIPGILQSYRKACLRGGFGTVLKFVAGHELIADIDRFIPFGHSRLKAPRK